MHLRMHDARHPGPPPRVHKTLPHSARGGGERRADLRPREPSETTYFFQRAAYLDPGSWRCGGVRRTLVCSLARAKNTGERDCQRRGTQITGLRLIAAKLRGI